ncbi:MAG: TIGR02281 family clan AA aspartic protease [Devosia sp.]
MIFIGIALLVAAGLAIAVNADAGALVGLSQDQAGHIVPLLLVLILVAGAMFARRRPFGELIGGLVLWIGVFGIVLAGYTYRDEIMSVASRMYGELTPGQPIVDSRTGNVSFRRGLGGHFEVSARINGARIPLIFDTGASAMVLTASDARKAGIDTSHLLFSTPVSTANGTGRAAIVSLDHIDVGGIVRSNVRAYVTENDALETSLLGMTFLETLSRYAVTKDSLELTN